MAELSEWFVLLFLSFSAPWFRLPRKESCVCIFLWIKSRRKEKNLHLLSGEQYVSPLVDLPDESLCFPHAVVALPLPLQVLHLQEIQCGSKEWDRSPQKCREQEKQVKRDNWKNRSEVMRKRGTDMEEGIRGKGLKQRCKETGRSSV